MFQLVEVSLNKQQYLLRNLIEYAKNSMEDFQTGYTSIVPFCIRNYLDHFVQITLIEVLFDNQYQKLNNLYICMQYQGTTRKLYLWCYGKRNQSH
jgi:hypothetical protein